MGSELIPVLKPELPMSLPNEPQPAADEASARLYMDTKNAVVKISTDKAKTASGFLVDAEHIVTSSRNLLGTKEQFAFGPDGKRYKLELEKMDELKDLAVLRIKNGSIPGMRSLPLGATEPLNPDDRVWALSFPQSADSSKPYLSPGYVRGFSAPMALLLSNSPGFAEQLHDKLKDLDLEDQNEAELYLAKPAVDSKLHVEAGSGGSPILEKDGKVVAVTTMTNGLEPRQGQTLAASVEDLKELLAGKGRFEFSYKNSGADWAEQYKADWQNNKLKAVVDTALTGTLGGLAYRAAGRFPVVAATGLGTYGLVKLSSDLSHLLKGTDSADSWKYGLASLADLGTVSGAALSLAPKLRGYGLALAGIGLAGRAATDFIANRRVLDGSKRIEGDPDRPPFNLDDLLNK